MWHRLVWQEFANDSQGDTLFMFRSDSRFLRNTSKYQTDYTFSKSERQYFASFSSSQPQIPPNYIGECMNIYFKCDFMSQFINCLWRIEITAREENS